MTDHTWEEPVATQATLAFDGRVMHLDVFSNTVERLGLVSKLCFVSYLTGPGRHVVLGGRTPIVPP